MIFLVLRLKKRTRSPSFWSSQIEQSSASNTAGRKRNGFQLFTLRHSDDRFIVSHIDRNTARQYLRCLLRYWRICATLSSWLGLASDADRYCCCRERDRDNQSSRWYDQDSHSDQQTSSSAHNDKLRWHRHARCHILLNG